MELYLFYGVSAVFFSYEGIWEETTLDGGDPIIKDKSSIINKIKVLIHGESELEKNIVDLFCKYFGIMNVEERIL